MKKAFLMLVVAISSLGCSNLKSDYTTKPVFCYQLAPQEQAPGKNCIGSGGHQ